MQFDYDEMESKLSITEAKHASLKSENKSLVGHVSTAKEQARQKVEHKINLYCVVLCTSGTGVTKS